MNGRRSSDPQVVPDPSTPLEATIVKLRDTLDVVTVRSGVLLEDIAELRAHLKTCSYELSALREQIPRLERTHAIELRVGRDATATLIAENRTLREAGEAPPGES